MAKCAMPSKRSCSSKGVKVRDHRQCHLLASDYLFHVPQAPLPIGFSLLPQFGQQEPVRKIYETLWREFARGPQMVEQLVHLDPKYPDQDGTFPMYLKETLFEFVRSFGFTSRPSRFDSIFLFQSLVDAQLFKEEYARPHILVCKVQAARLTGLDMRLSGPLATDPLAPIGQQAKELIGRAIRYWQGATTSEPCIEVLATGGVVTVAEILR